MARKRRSNDNHSIGDGLATRQTKRKKPISSEYLVDVEPLTENQRKLFKAYEEGKHLVAYGAAGTGKTFITLIMHSRMYLMRQHHTSKFMLFVLL
jgi:phosphate starvation-inducible PhoH-like protein